MYWLHFAIGLSGVIVGFFAGLFVATLDDAEPEPRQPIDKDKFERLYDLHQRRLTKGD